MIFKRQAPRLKVIWLVIFSVMSFGCIKSLDSPECIEARDQVKQFYSYHFDNLVNPDAEVVRTRASFVVDRLKPELDSEAGEDYFTKTVEHPKAFRVGECRTIDDGRIAFDIVLFWRSPERTEERQIVAEAVKENNRWLINKVENK